MNFKADVPIADVLALFFQILTFHHVFTYAALVTLSSLALISRFSLRSPLALQHQTLQRTKPPKAIHAVHALITPSHGPSWPIRYHELATRADISQSNEITLPLELVVRDFISGLIEIRGYENDITWLLRNRLESLGWTVLIDGQFDIDKLCSMDVSGRSTPEERHENVHRSKLPPMFTFNVSHLYHPQTHITLDDIPQQDMNTAIHRFKNSMVPVLKYKLEFSALRTMVPSDANLDMLKALFNYQYSFSRLAPKIKPEYRRCPSPLVFTFASIKTMLNEPHPFPSSTLHSSDSKTDFEIVSIEDVSKQYTCQLVEQSCALFPLPSLVGSYRDTVYRSLTVEERRADALMLRLEAALYPDADHLHGAGLLGRFVVVVRRR